jgi:integrase
VHVGLWAAAEDVALAALDDQAVRVFLAHLSRCRCPGHRAGRHGVARAHTEVFVRYLRTRGVVPVAVPPVAPPALITGFCEWMRSQRGSAETTVRQYRAVAIALLGRLGDDPARYEAGAVRAAVHEVIGGHGTATARSVAKVARGFLRYLAVTGLCRPGLDAAILPVANWRRASLPRYVSAESVQRIIDACDATRPDGVRDRAILLLLARLGLRAGDIVRLGVRDIDWAAARVRVVGKGRREVRLPLPQEVGDATPHPPTTTGASGRYPPRSPPSARGVVRRCADAAPPGSARGRSNRGSPRTPEITASRPACPASTILAG